MFLLQKWLIFPRCEFWLWEHWILRCLFYFLSLLNIDRNYYMETSCLTVQSHSMLMCVGAGAWHTWMMIIPEPGWMGGVTAPPWLQFAAHFAAEQTLIACNFNSSGYEVEPFPLGWPCCRSNLWERHRTKTKLLEEHWPNHCRLKCHLGVITAAWGNQGILAVIKCCTWVSLGQAEAVTWIWIHVRWC